MRIHGFETGQASVARPLKTPKDPLTVILPRGPTFRAVGCGPGLRREWDPRVAR